MKKLSIIAACCIAAGGAIANEAGFQASLTPDTAIQDRDTNITGVSIGIWNENPSPKFQWQIGFVNGAPDESVGIQGFLFLPTLFNYAENYTGAQVGFVNRTSKEFAGVQLGAINVAGDLTGLQWGAINHAKNTTSGVQLGLINHTGSVKHWAIQLGLVNIITENEWFSDFPSDLARGMVFVNWSFGGTE